MPDPFDKVGEKQKKKEQKQKKAKKQKAKKQKQKNKKQKKKVEKNNKKKKTKSMNDYAKSKSKSGGQKKKVKKGSKISLKMVGIGCFVGLVIIIGLFVLGLTAVINSPDMMDQLGISKQETKNIFEIFIHMFFVPLMLFFLTIVLVNVYKLMVRKASKLKYAFGSFLTFVLLGGSMAGWFRSINKVQSIKTEKKDQYKSEKMLNGMIVHPDNNIQIQEDVPKIAPMKIKYWLNRAKFLKRVRQKGLGVSDLGSVQLDCGNQQKPFSIKAAKLLNDASPKLPGECLYLENKDYEVKLTYSYENANTGKIEKDMMKFNRSMDAKIDVSIEGKNLDKTLLDDEGSQIRAGEVPVNVSLDARDIFAELGLNDNQISWDLDNDGQPEEKNNQAPNYTIKNVGKNIIKYKINGVGDYVFPLEIWTKQSSVTPCNIQVSNIGGSKYKFVTNFDSSVNAKSYKFKVQDISQAGNEKIIKEKKVSNPEYVYSFDKKGIYQIEFEYINSEGKKGICESKKINRGLEYKPKYNMKINNSELSKFKDLEAIEKNKYRISVIPSTLKLKINKIVSSVSSKEYDIELKVDGENISPIGSRTFEIDIDESKDYQGQIIVKDQQGNSDSHSFKIVSERKALVPRLSVDPNVGESPMDVTLDASASKLRSDDDEIIYFTWYFGDGEVFEKSSDGVVSHMYEFDNKNDNGTYKPRVEIETKKGYTAVTTGKVMVKRPSRSIDINFPSHPTQIAQVGDRVDMSVSPDGRVEKITWRFGNGDKLSGKGRSYMNVTKTYKETGNYKIKVIVEYKNSPTVQSSIKLQVK